VKRRDTSGERSSETQGLRAQLSRAVGGSIDALRSALSSNPKTVEVSKQRLSDMLWNDRTILKTDETAVARAAHAANAANAGNAANVANHGNEAAEDLESLPEADVVELTPGPQDEVVLEPESELADAEANAAAASGEPRKRVDTRPSDIVRARLERAKARAAERLMPKGVAPIADSLEADRADPTPLPANELAGFESIEAHPLEAQLDEASPPRSEIKAPLESRTWLNPSSEAEQTKDAFLADLAPPASEPVATRPTPPAPPVAAASDGDEEGEEPIRTRSMARLLAMQGHRGRALKIYDALLAANSGDESLRAEADALRHAG
jgi:hypothetical protein